MLGIRHNRNSIGKFYLFQTITIMTAIIDDKFLRKFYHSRFNKSNFFNFLAQPGRQYWYLFQILCSTISALTLSSQLELREFFIATTNLLIKHMFLTLSHN